MPTVITFDFIKNIIETEKLVPTTMLIHLTNQFDGDAIEIDETAFHAAFDSAMREYTSLTKGGDAYSEYNTDVLAVEYLTIAFLFVNNDKKFEYWRDKGYKTCLSAYAEKRAGLNAKKSSFSKRNASNKAQINPMLPADSETEPDSIIFD